MRKIIGLVAVAASMLLSFVLTALPAMAQQYPPTPPAETDVVQGPTEVAFTGRDVTPLIIAVAALLIVGVSALLIARRRAAAAR